MCDTLSQWQIKYLNLSGVSESRDIKAKLKQNSPRNIIASIEKISDGLVQKSLLDIKLEYIAVDEAQVRLAIYQQLINCYEKPAI